LKVYLHGDNAEKSSYYTVTVAPAGDTLFVRGGDVLDDWKLADGSAKQFEIVFDHGVAEVDDCLGNYMIARGIAQKSRLVRKVRQLFDNLGRAVNISIADGELAVSEAA
jgi:hypothetical protein